MNAFRSRIERIVNASVAGLKVVVEDVDVFTLIYVKHGHTVDGSAFSFTSGRVKNVVCANNDSSVNVFEISVDIVHFVKVFVLYVSFAKKNVHMTRHTACNGVNCVSNLSAVSNELVSKFLDKVLSLSDSHTVTRNDNYVLGVIEHSCVVDFFLNCGSFYLSGLSRGSCLCGSSGGGSSGLTEQDRAKTAVHSLAHNLSQEQSACAYDTANCNEQEVVDCKTCNCASYTAKAVKE